MRWSRDFTALLLGFAETVSAVGDIDREEVLRTWTPFYLNLGGLSRSFDPLAPTWKEFVAGIITSDDPAEWAHSFYLEHCSLFPPEYIRSATAVEPELQFMSLWGQFLDRTGSLRLRPAQLFRANMTAADTLDTLRQSFPFPVLAPRCAIDSFPDRYAITAGGHPRERQSLLAMSYTAGVTWEVEFTDEFLTWWHTLTDDEQEKITATVARLEEQGPTLGRPNVDTLTGTSEVHHLKELRPPASTIRILFAFDPRRTAVLLIGGDKAVEWNKWYERMIPMAERLYKEHLEALRKEGLC